MALPGLKTDKDLVHNNDKETEENEAGITKEYKTFSIILEAANRTRDYLNFTLDLPEFHPNGRVPMLDLETWVEDMNDENGNVYSQILYSFFEKQVTTNVCHPCQVCVHPQKQDYDRNNGNISKTEKLQYTTEQRREN